MNFIYCAVFLLLHDAQSGVPDKNAHPTCEEGDACQPLRAQQAQEAHWPELPHDVGRIKAVIILMRFKVWHCGPAAAYYQLPLNFSFTVHAFVASLASAWAMATLLFCCASSFFPIYEV